MSKYFDRDYELTVTAINGEVLTYRPPMEIRFAIDNSRKMLMQLQGSPYMEFQHLRVI